MCNVTSIPAARYDVNFKRDDNNTITTYSSNETQEAGMLVTIITQLPDCDVLFHITVSATDSQSVQGKESNEVREMVSCSATETPPIDPPNPPTPLGTGAIVGIVIGVILFLVILAIGIYLFMNRDNLDDLWLWQMLTCRCLRKPKNEKLSQPPPPRSTINEVGLPPYSGEPSHDPPHIYENVAYYGSQDDQHHEQFYN